MPSDFDLRSLDEEPPTPSRVDVDRAIVDGRRRKTRRGVGYAGAATLTVAAVVGASMVVGGLATDSPTGTPAASGQPKGDYTIPGTAGWQAPAATPPTSCVLERLPVPDNEPMALTSGVDPTGEYIVGRTYPDGGGYRAVIWQDGQATAVDLPGDEEESLQDVNSAGAAVGWSYEGGGPIPYVFSGGQVSRLPGVEHGSASAINDAGAIVGDDDLGGGALVWPSATAEPTRLPLPEGATGTAADIDEDGTVVGNLDVNGTTGDEDATVAETGERVRVVAGDEARPYVWFADGTHREIPLPTLDGARATSGRVLTVRNGWATGWASTAPAGQMVAVRWNLRTGETRTFDDLSGPADAVNTQGWVVGLGKEESDALLVTDDGSVKLPALFDHAPGGLTTIPSGLTDDGRLIVGQSDDESGTIQPVVWRCE